MPLPENMRLMGPAEAPVPRLKAEYRYQILIKSASRKALNHTLNRAKEFASASKWQATALVVDVDPLTLL
jgi:primosomal protein N' (replication factor Y)